MPTFPEPAPKHLPRILTKADAAAYCGLTEPGFDTWVKTRKLPGAMKGTRRWDKVALDFALNRLSGVSLTAPLPKPSSLAKFIVQREAKKAADAARQAEADRKSVNPAAQRRHRERIEAEAACNAKAGASGSKVRRKPKAP